MRPYANVQRRAPVRPALRRLAGTRGGYPGEALPRRYRAEHARARPDLRPLTDPRAGQQGRPRTDDRAGPDPDPSDVDGVAVDPVAGQVDLGLDRSALAQPQHAGHRRQGVQVHTRGQLHAQRAGVPRQPDTGQVRRTAELGQLLRHPQSHVDSPAARVGTRSHAAQQQPGAAGSDEDATGRADEQQPAGEHPPPRRGRRPRGVQQVVDGGEHHQPPQAHQAHQHRQQRGLRQAGPAGYRCDGARRGLPRTGLVEYHGQRAHRRMLVQVGDRDTRVPSAQQGNQPRGTETGATAGEEVVVRARRGSTQHVSPLLGQPRLGAGQIGRRRGAGQRQRPRKCFPVNLSGRPGGQRVDGRQQRHQCGREGGAQPGECVGRVERVRPGRHDVTDQDLVAAPGPAYRRGRTRDTGQRVQRGVDLTELDAPAAELDLFVRAADEDETVGLGADQIAAASPHPLRRPGTVPARPRR